MSTIKAKKKNTQKKYIVYEIMAFESKLIK